MQRKRRVLAPAVHPAGLEFGIARKLYYICRIWQHTRDSPSKSRAATRSGGATTSRSCAAVSTPKRDEMSYKAIPAVVYTNPELASVGKTEEELVANGESFRVQKIPMTYSGRFVAENENSNGLCKLITDDEDRIIGCHLLGNPASEIIVTAGIAVENGYTVDEFKKNIFPHPTVSEILHESLYI